MSNNNNNRKNNRNNTNMNNRNKNINNNIVKMYTKYQGHFANTRNATTLWASDLQFPT